MEADKASVVADILLEADLMGHTTHGLHLLAPYLADIEKVSAPSMTRTVAAIVDNGWAGRAGDPDDGRQVIVTLTAAGRQVLRETRRAREGWMAKRFSDLSDDEIETLARATTILERIAAS